MTREQELLEVAEVGGLMELREVLPGTGFWGRLTGRGLNINAQDAEGNTAVLIVARRANNRMLKLLLERGADPNVQNARGETALFPTASRGDVEAVTALLAAGADVRLRNGEGYTALHRAAGPGGPETSPQVASLLLTHGADPNAPGLDADTPLHVSARHGTTGVAELLLANGARPDEVTRRGHTPLQLAMRAGNLDIAELVRKASGSTAAEE